MVKTGTNRRYAHRVAEYVDREIARTTGLPEGLTPVELDLASAAITTPPRPVPAHAWLRFAGRPQLVAVVVSRWTARAVEVRLPNGGDDDAVWVWRGAISPRRANGAPGLPERP